MGVPYGQIEYFPARDGQSYVGDAGRAVEEALKEGWKLSSQMAERYSQRSDAGALKWFCMRWTFTVILQEIMNAPSNKYFMFLIDDFCLKRPYHELRHMMKFAMGDSQKLGKPAAIIQLDVFELFDCPRVET